MRISARSPRCLPTIAEIGWSLAPSRIPAVARRAIPELSHRSIAAMGHALQVSQCSRMGLGYNGQHFCDGGGWLGLWRMLR